MKATLEQLDWMLNKVEDLWQQSLISGQTMDDMRTAINIEKELLTNK